MKDTAKLLNFNSNRDLSFDTERGVDFNLDRQLGFDVNRELSFDVNRDLEIRYRGVVFRGFVCPRCGGLVAEDAKECDECHIQFKQETHKNKEKKRERKRKGKRQAPGKTRGKQGRTEQRATFNCPNCSKLLY